MSKMWLEQGAHGTHLEGRGRSHGADAAGRSSFGVRRPRQLIELERDIRRRSWVVRPPQPHPCRGAERLRQSGSVSISKLTDRPRCDCGGVMRLIDKVVQAPLVEVVVDGSGREHAMPGAGTFADELRACPVRYILDRDASRQCASLFRTSECLPDPRDPLARPPARSFWLEFNTDGEGPPPDCHASGLKMGVFARFSEDERSGTLICFHEKAPDRSAEFLQYEIAFDFHDFDSPLPRPPGSLRLRHQDSPEVDRLLSRTSISFTEEWTRWSRATGPGCAAQAAAVAHLAWCAAPMVTCFSALLNTETVLRQTGSELERVNKARARRRQPPLLDHVEVRLDLTAMSGSSAERGSTGGTRQTPRLHLVRGHSIHRNGKTFWRSSHFRGDTLHPLVRNVSVSASGRR